MDSNTLIMTIIGNSLSFLPRGFPEYVFIFNSKRAVRGVRETVRGGSRRGSGDRKRVWSAFPFSPSRQGGLTYTWSQYCLDSPGPIFFFIGDGRSVILSLEADDGNSEENFAFHLKTGQKAKRFFADFTVAS